jgi:trimethylamine:corrinoid methyltransferase-like protein
LDAQQRATKVWQDLLRYYEQPEMDTAVNDALVDFVARRERELEKQNLYE